MDRRPFTLVVGALWALLVFMSVGLAAGPEVGVATAAPGSTKNAPALTLLSQSPWVGPAQSFTARLGVTGSAAKSTLALRVTVYSYLTTRSAFDQTLTSPPSGRTLSQSSPVALSSLPADTAGGFDVSVAVSAGGSTSAATSPFAVNLNCAPGSCGGVYPVALTLTNTSGKTVMNELTTYLVYDAPPTNTERLRMAMVVPLSLPAAAPDRAGNVAAPTESALAALTTVGSGLATHPDVPVTIDPDPASALAMSTDGRQSAHRALTALTGSADAASRQVLCGPFTQVNPSVMFADGLGSEITSQVQRGAQVLAAVGVHAPQCSGASATWVALTTADATAVSGLASLGYHDVVVAPSAVAGPNPYTTPTRLFTLSAAHAGTTETDQGAGLTAAVSDSTIDQQLQAASGPTAVQAAYQILSELALIYYEAPNTPGPRGVVAVSPNVWAPNPAFLSSLLGGLDQNPVVAPVTIDDFFAQVPIGGTVGGVTQPAERHPATAVASTGPSALPAQAIRVARQRLSGFAAAVAPSGTSIATGIEDQLLRSESDEIKASQQVAGVNGAEASLAAQLAKVSIRTDTIRLTAISANVPITVLYNAPYAMNGTLCLSSDKLLFPMGRCQQTATLQHFTNSFIFAIRARASGDFHVSVSFTSPDGQLVISSAQLSVRSMSTSAVAIALSLAAVAVLLLWWGRTIWRGRRSGYGAHAQLSRRARLRSERRRIDEGNEVGSDEPLKVDQDSAPDPVT